jgi:hypothetical protein
VLKGVCFLCTIDCHSGLFSPVLNLPPFLGMMTGLGYLMFAQYYMQKWGEKAFLKKMGLMEERRKVSRYEFFKQVEQVEFDTLLFFLVF